MRQLFSRLREPERVVAAYAEAEIAGEVDRKNNARDISQISYAERLFADGIRKRWIYTR